MPVDNFKYHPAALDVPATRHYAITPSDAVDLPVIPRYLYVLTSGNLSLVDEKGTAITYPVTAGQRLEFRATRVRATGTTATVAGWD